MEQNDPEAKITTSTCKLVSIIGGCCSVTFTLDLKNSRVSFFLFAKAEAQSYICGPSLVTIKGGGHS